MNIVQKKFISFSLLVSVLVLVAGCGKSDGGSTDNSGGVPAAVPLGVGGTPAGTPFTPPVTQYWDTCPGAIVDFPTTGVARCTHDILPEGTTLPNALRPGFPRLTPPTPNTLSGTGIVSTAQAVTYALQVYPGDRLYMDASGSFEQLGSGFFSSCGSNPTYDLQGNIISGSGSTRNQGFQPVSTSADTNLAGDPAILAQPSAACMAAAVTVADVQACLTPVSIGLVASVGNQIYAVGSHFDGNITKTGYLSTGFNSPWDVNHICFSLTFTNFKHQRCVDTNGNLVVCPLDSSFNLP